MSYSVRWSRRALDALAEIWLDNPDQRAAVTESSATIDQLLRFDPQEQGESREEDDRRVLFVPPLVAIFSVDEAHRVVRVLSVRLMKRRTK